MIFQNTKLRRGMTFPDKGSVLIVLIVTILAFAVLAAVMVSLTGTALFGQLNTASTTEATYLAKSGYNYLASQFKSAATEAAKNAVLENLHNANYQLVNNGGSFSLNVKPNYMISQQILTVTNANGLRLNVEFPGDVSYAIPSSGTDKLMAVFTSSGWRRFYYTTVTTLGVNSYRLNLSNTNPPDGQPFTIQVGESVVPVLSLSSNQTLATNGNLTVANGTGGILPDRFGFFEMPRGSNASGYVFYYDHRIGDTLYGIRDANQPDRVFSYTTTNTTRLIYVHTAAQITSTGTFNPGSASQVSSTFSRTAILGLNPGGFSDNVPHNVPGFDNWVRIGTGVAIDASDPDPANQIVFLGQGDNDTAGVAWYAGDSVSANCAAGLCDFGVGIRAYFEFRDTNGSADSGDGFMFMIMNGILNDTTKRGGTPSAAGMGELMGYAGPGNTHPTSALPRATPPLDGLGLQPPKISIEFDRYNNPGINSAGCGNGRNDAAGNHMALMLWGNNTAGNCSNGLPAVSYDDNVHGQGTWGSAVVPRNSTSGDSVADGSRGYFNTSFADTTTREFRIEVTRAATPNGSGNYDYNVKAWIDCTACNDVSTAFSGSAPQINRTIELTPTLHANFHKMFFGFTQGTGGATQNLEITRFDIFFPPY
ncbi:MAG: hypothetical protein EG826_15540 [Deltaproteobacteria bacterium]|nr:hypothetical protein [Deltaproteobacteria bacterium]